MLPCDLTPASMAPASFLTSVSLCLAAQRDGRRHVGGRVGRHQSSPYLSTTAASSFSSGVLAHFPVFFWKCIVMHRYASNHFSQVERTRVSLQSRLKLVVDH